MSAENTIRPAAVAGQFYPRQPEALRLLIEQSFLSPFGPGSVPQVAKEGRQNRFGIVAPHAGYVYSAQAAAWSYAALARAGRPDTVILLGVNHRGIGAPLALSPATAWETPFGTAPVARELGQQLCALDAEIHWDAAAHAQEHSLEVQVPLLQFLFADLPILPIAIGSASIEAVLRLGDALGTLTATGKIGLIASTDFSHYVSQRQAEQQDKLAMEQIVRVDARGLIDTVRMHDITMCGVLPVAAVLAAAAQNGVTHGEILHYHTSGDIIGEKQQVVGYGALALYRPDSA